MPRCDMSYRWEENVSIPINPEVFPRFGVGLEEPLKRDADLRCRDRHARVGCCFFQTCQGRMLFFKRVRNLSVNKYV